MKYFKGLFAVLCLRCVGFSCAVSLKNEAGNSLSMQQQLELILAGAASNQPHRLGKATQVDKKVSLLSVMQNLQSNENEQHANSHQLFLTTKKAKLNLQRAAAGQTLRERQLLSNMGRLEDQLKSERNIEHHLEQQMESQQQTVLALQEGQSSLVEDEMVTVKAWRNCKVQSCLALSIAMAIFFYSMKSPKKNQPRQEVPSSTSTKQKETNASEALVPPPVPAKAENVQSMSLEVLKQLNDLADAVGRVKMPSEEADQVAMQAIETSERETFNHATEPLAEPRLIATGMDDE